MKTSKLFNGINHKVFGSDENIEIKGLKHKSEECESGDVFFCLKGEKFDGHDFYLDAIKNGASVIVSERKLCVPGFVKNIVVESARSAMAECASNYFDRPSKDMKIVMVTGTNGKTTSTYMIESILKVAGMKTGVIGTNGAFVGNNKIETNMTTPDPIELQKIMKDMKDSGVEVVIMEMSAHALELQKNRGVVSDIAVFTNLTEDHLDFFSSMEKYGEAKKKLFQKNATKFAVLNMDDGYAYEIINNISVPYATVGMNDEFDFFASDIKRANVGQSFTLNHDDHSFEVMIQMDGKFNISNALGAIAVAKRLGISDAKIQEGLEKMKGVPGRFNTYFVNGKKFIVDYAHTPDGLANILLASREILDKGKKLISVFGCGGNREKEKRSIMGALSTELADKTIITSDNPRFENPLDIIHDIESGVHAGAEYYIEPDRKKAILLAYKLAEIGDIVVVSGKGAEDYIDKGGVKTHYKDSEVIEEIEKGK